MNRSTTWSLALVVAAMLLGACSNTGDPGTSPRPGDGASVGSADDAGLYPADQLNKAIHTGTPARGGQITFGVESDIVEVAPNGQPVQPAEMQLAYAVYDPLVYFGDEGEYAGLPVLDNTDHKVNQMAEKLEVTNDLKTWTLTLRDDVKFSDGTPLTAEAVVGHTEWAKDSPNCFCKGDAANIERVWAPDPHTVVYELETPMATFPSKLTRQGLAWIVKPEARAAAPDPDQPDIEHLISTGPFRFESVKSDTWTVVRNDHYYGVDPATGASLPYLDQITFLPLGDSVTRLQALQSGGVDIIQTADTANLVAAKKDASLMVQPVQGSSSTIIGFDLTRPPFGVSPEHGESAQDAARRALEDPEALAARQAYNAALDRNEVNQKLFSGTRMPAYGLIPSSNAFFDPDAQLPRFDLARATELVAEVRVADVPVQVDTLCINSSGSTQMMEILQQQHDAAGFEVTHQPVEQALFVDTVLAGGDRIDWNAACFRTTEFADPDRLYEFLVTGESTNFVKYSRAEVDEWMNEARETVDPARRKELYDRVQKRVTEDVVYVPITFDYFGNVFSKHLSGLSTPSPEYLGTIRPGDLYTIAGG